MASYQALHKLSSHTTLQQRQEEILTYSTARCQGKFYFSLHLAAHSIKGRFFILSILSLLVKALFEII
jgi:hypothetical protein